LGPTPGTVLPGNHEVAQRDHRAGMNCTKAGAACETTRRRLDRIVPSVNSSSDFEAKETKSGGSQRTESQAAQIGGQSEEDRQTGEIQNQARAD
jgi:hypothetical protein